MMEKLELKIKIQDVLTNKRSSNFKNANHNENLKRELILNFGFWLLSFVKVSKLTFPIPSLITNYIDRLLEDQENVNNDVTTRGCE